MLEEDFSPALERALQTARQTAAALRLDAVEPSQLLFALLADEDSRAFTLLVRHGAAAPQLTDHQLTENDAAASAEVARPSDLTFSREVWSILNRARRSTAAVGYFEPIDSEDVLAALLEEWPEAVTFCARHGIDRELLLREYHAGKTPAADPIQVGPIDFNPRRAGEESDLARIIDAAFNRASEALRVVEDYARFALDDRLLCRRLKSTRHGLRTAIERLPHRLPTPARNTSGDVGATIQTAEESQRSSIGDVVIANLKRAQQALRTLEEYAKIDSCEAASELEKLRYALYEIEKTAAIGERSRQRLDGVQVYWLADPARCAKDFRWTVEEAIAGGATAIQLRDKTATDRELLERAIELRNLTEAAGALLIVNDRPDIARLSGADGVHLGQDDLPIHAARKIIGPDAIIGISTHDLTQARRAVEAGADYLGIGPVFASSTKQFERLAGLEFVKAAAEEIRLPAFCIGGIDLQNAAQVIAAGGRRIAVSTAIGMADEPAIAAGQLRALLSTQRS